MAQEVLIMLLAGEPDMLERNTDAAVLGLVSILYSIAIFFLKQRKA
jgi:hypothetical protein